MLSQVRGGMDKGHEFTLPYRLMPPHTPITINSAAPKRDASAADW